MESNSLFPDPMKMWRDAVTNMEKDFNSRATESMKDPETVRSMQQMMAATEGMQQSFEQALETYLHTANLPTRKDINALSEKLDIINEKIDTLQRNQASRDSVPRPSRTRRPPSADATAEKE
ncbi:MAG: phasin family protein [Corynebacterium sp.]|jgi:hypothetical protein|uniref:phasin family protein n=1 Tax=unclassified Corynebacterium TaxID=2624378 RepID=UPI0009618538|nr:phasin family protein [Corynebacterium sp. CNJ-954]OLT54186.1 hypothetical protein BJF89_17315 [Corynebacterium sp. CNJ-954]